MHDLKPTDEYSKVLKTVHLEPNHCNLHVIYEEQLEPLATTQEENPPGNPEGNQGEIPVENQEDIREEYKEDIQEENQKEIPEVNSEGTEEENRAEYPEENPGENPQENEFVAVDVRNVYHSNSGDDTNGEDTDSYDSEIFMPDDLMEAVHNAHALDEHIKSLEDDTDTNYDDLTPTGKYNIQVCNTTDVTSDV